MSGKLAHAFDRAQAEVLLLYFTQSSDYSLLRWMNFLRNVITRRGNSKQASGSAVSGYSCFPVPISSASFVGDAGASTGYT